MTLTILLAAAVLTAAVGPAGSFGVAFAQQPVPGAQQSVATLVQEWLGYLNNQSVSGLASLYAPEASLVWGGTVGIFGGGVFSGQNYVRLLYGALFQNTTLLTAIPTPVNTSLFSASSVNATFGLNLTAQRGSEGTYEFSIRVEQHWVGQNGAWLIQDETWINNDYSFNAVTSTTTQTAALGPEWTVEPYPLLGPPSGESGENCVTDSDFLYCIGGALEGTSDFYLQLGLDGGVGTWKTTTSYPLSIENEGCVDFRTQTTGVASVLCVGGNDTGATPALSTNRVYLAQLSPGGGIIGPWQTMLDYPVSIWNPSCAVDAGIDGYVAEAVFCVGGSAGTGSTAVYYAQVGAYAWNFTTPLPTAALRTCFIAQVYIYCIASGSRADTVYYAQVSSQGIVGGWKETEPYPTPVYDENCVTSGGYDDYVFCIGGLTPQGGTGDVYYAHLSHTGAGIQGIWMSATDSPIPFDYGGCVEAISTIWCNSGGSIYYNEILGPDAPTVTRTVTIAPATATVTTTLTASTVSASFLTEVSATGPQARLLPEVYGLFAIAVVFVASTVYYATRRRS